MNIRFLKSLVFILAFSAFSAVSFIGDAGSSYAQGSKIKEAPYVPMTYQNLSKAYWAIGKFDVSNNRMIDNFLKINECDLYIRYSTNEFQWDELREVTKESILHRMATFPTKFEIVREIELGEYDVENEEFLIAPESQSHGTTRVQVKGEDIERVCDSSTELDGYPAIVIYYFNRPFNLVKFPLHPQIAELYIEEIEEKYAQKVHPYRLSSYKRNAFLRMKVRMTQFKEDLYGMYGHKVAVYARIDGFEIYADKDMKKLLYSHKFESRRARRAVKKKRSTGEGSSAKENSEDAGKQSSTTVN